MTCFGGSTATLPLEFWTRLHLNLIALGLRFEKKTKPLDH